MHRKYRKILSILLVVSVAAGLSGCTTYDNFKNAYFPSGSQVAKEKTIKIGIYEPKSGKYKSQGEEEIAGIELAHEIYPEVLGKKIELVYADNKSNIYDAETAIKELLKSSPSVVLGSYGETLSLVASDYLKGTNTPGITISSTNPLITVNSDYYFSATYSETREGDALAEFAYESQKKDVTAAIKIDGDDSYTATIKRFSNRIKKLTGKSSSYAGAISLPKDSNDFSEAIEQLRSSGAKAVFLAVPPVTAESFISQCIDNNLTHVLFLGTRECKDEKLLELVKKNPKINIGYCAEYPKNTSSELSDEFMSAYKAKYGMDAEPSGKTAAAFDAYVLAVNAIRDAYNYVIDYELDDVLKETKSEGQAQAVRGIWQQTVNDGIPNGILVKEALKNVEDFNGASGMINFAGDNETTKTISINHISGGREMPVYVVE